MWFEYTAPGNAQNTNQSAQSVTEFASISSSNAAFLDGSTVPLAEYASAATIQITLGDDSQCTVLFCIYLITDLGDDSQCTRGKAVQLQIKYLSR